MALRDGDVKAAIAARHSGKRVPRRRKLGRTAQRRLRRGNHRARVPGGRRTGYPALNRGDYLQAMDLLYRGKALYWADVADVAERVLTVDELKGFVDKHAPAPTTLKPVNPDDYGGQQITPEVQLRELLARRLMRVGRAPEAQAYFDIPNYRRGATVRRRAEGRPDNPPRR